MLLPKASIANGEHDLNPIGTRCRLHLPGHSRPAVPDLSGTRDWWSCEILMPDALRWELEQWRPRWGAAAGADGAVLTGLPLPPALSDTFLTGHGPFPFRVLGLGAADPCSRPSRVVSPTKGITRKSDLLKTKTDLRPHS